MEKAVGELFSKREPMLLLVWNKEKTFGYLKRCGFDTSGWRTGLKAFFDYSHRTTPDVQVCVIDVKLLCEQVFSGRQAVESLRHAATLLKLSTVVQGQCAGNDARYVSFIPTLEVKLNHSLSDWSWRCSAILPLGHRSMSRR